LLGGEADPAVIAVQDAQFHKLASILDQRLSQHTWVAGDHVTIADIALAAPMHLHGWQQLPLDNHRHLKRWLTTAIEGLPCWQKTMIYQGFTTQKPN
jgi:glutathione S-transferase